MLISCLSLRAQTDTMPLVTAEDSLELALIDSLYADSMAMADTVFYSRFIPYDRTIWRNSKINLRKTLSASKNPPLRNNLNNYTILIWGLFIVLLILFFKSNYPLQYRLLNKAWYSNISFNEFFEAQTSVFKNSKMLTWFIISQCVAMGVYIIIRSVGSDIRIGELPLILLISLSVIVLFVANQWLKNVFAYSFYQPSLSRDYAIIYRINSYIASLFLLPVLMLFYYNGGSNIKMLGIATMVIYVLIVYSSSLVKFIFTGRFLQNQSNFILILYLCAFEILPLLVLMKSVNNLLEYD